MVNVDFTPALKYICVMSCFIRLVVGPIAVLILSLAALHWLKSEDKPDERKQSKQQMKNVLAGIVIITIGYIVVEAILGSASMVNCDAVTGNACPV
ncbi:MAG: hypothetical protein V1921_00805 [Candidatus Altiarchaeota archaeon]